MNRQVCTGGLVLTLGLLAVGLSSCVPMDPADVAPDARMWIHFDEAGDLQMAMVRGDLDRAREAARRIERVVAITGLPEGSEEELMRLRSYATAIREADDYGVAALGTSLLAASCGDCHATYGVGPAFAEVGDLPEDRGNHMVEHVWAADRMWEGLVIPDPARWQTGARVLAYHEVPMDALAPGTSQYGVDLKTLGLESLRETDLSEQARRYGEILVTCSGCHTSTGG